MTKQVHLPNVEIQQKQQKFYDLIDYVKHHSPFYGDLYRDVHTVSPQLTDLPILNLTEFWQANSVDQNQVFTQPLDNGITFKSGGTTGNPKYSVFTNEEWSAFTKTFGQGMFRSGLAAQHRIGNLFYAGNLYASFLFIGRSLEHANVGMHYPIAGIHPQDILAVWQQFKLNCFAAIPTTFMSLLNSLNEQSLQNLSLDTFLYGGEPLFQDQLALIKDYFPACQVRSIGIAGVDYGELGWAAKDSGLGIHHCFDESTFVEILNDQHQPIEDMEVEGEIVLTNLQRRLMPIIRYPVGDKAVWIDPPHTPWRRFKVLGRNDSGARIGPMTLYIDDISNLVLRHNQQFIDHPILGFQIIIQHEACKDRCVLRLANGGEKHPQLSVQWQEWVYQQRPMFVELLNKNLIHPLCIEWVDLKALSINNRTGKIMRVIDQRHQTHFVSE